MDFEDTVRRLAEEANILQPWDELDAVDSLAFIAFLAKLEQRTGVTIPPEDLTVESFRSVATVVKLLETVAARV